MPKINNNKKNLLGKFPNSGTILECRNIVIVIRDIRSEGRDGMKRRVYGRSEETEPVQGTYRNRSGFGEIGTEESVLERRAKFGEKGTFLEEWGIKKGRVRNYRFGFR